MFLLKLLATLGIYHSTVFCYLVLVPQKSYDIFYCLDLIVTHSWESVDNLSMDSKEKKIKKGICILTRSERLILVDLKSDNCVL